LVLELEKFENEPEELGKLRMVTTMKGRCQLLEEVFGAKFYKEPALYEGFAFLGPPRHKVEKS
jgi:predicted secreted protein